MTYVEKMIARQCVADLLKARYCISVQDGEEIVLKRSTNAKAILAAMGTTDEDRLFVHSLDADADRPGSSFVYFVYGNDGWDVIQRYGVSLEPALAKTNALVDKLAA